MNSQFALSLRAVLSNRAFSWFNLFGFEGWGRNWVVWNISKVVQNFSSAPACSRLKGELSTSPTL